MIIDEAFAALLQIRTDALRSPFGNLGYGVHEILGHECALPLKLSFQSIRKMPVSRTGHDDSCRILEQRFQKIWFTLLLERFVHF
jgi:hypothetical protein